MPVELSCALPWLQEAVEDLLGSFATDDLPSGGRPIRVAIEPFAGEDVLRGLSSWAQPLHVPAPMDLYQDGERFWAIDERWGIARMDLLRGTVRTWLTAAAGRDPRRSAEMGLLWPLAQVVRMRGLHLLPTAAVQREGVGVLILAGHELDGELASLLGAGWRIIGARWTALRGDEEGVELLHMPGSLKRGSARNWASDVRLCSPWRDYLIASGACWHDAAACRYVVIAGRAWLGPARIRPVRGSLALSALRRAWPIEPLHPATRRCSVPHLLAGTCGIFAAELDGRASTLALLLDAMEGCRGQSSCAQVVLPNRSQRQRATVRLAGSAAAGIPG